MSDEKVYLKRWLSLKDGEGIPKAKSLSLKLFFIGGCLTIVVVFLLFFKFNSILVTIVSVTIGWTIAEGNALRSRVALWPMLEKYLNWELIRENVF